MFRLISCIYTCGLHEFLLILLLQALEVALCEHNVITQPGSAKSLSDDLASSKPLAGRIGQRNTAEKCGEEKGGKEKRFRSEQGRHDSTAHQAESESPSKHDEAPPSKSKEKSSTIERIFRKTKAEPIIFWQPVVSKKSNLG